MSNYPSSIYDCIILDLVAVQTEYQPTYWLAVEATLWKNLSKTALYLLLWHEFLIFLLLLYFLKDLREVWYNNVKRHH